MSALPPLHICIVTQQYGKITSGPGVHARLLVESLLKDGHRITLIAPHTQQPDLEQGFTFIPVPDPILSGNQARWIALALSFARTLRALQKSDPPDLIHFTDAREAFFTRTSIPTIGNINDTYAAELLSPADYRQNYEDWFARWVYYRFVHLTEIWNLPRLQAVIANSQFTARVVQQQYPRAARNLFQCYKAIPAEYFTPALQLRQSNPKGGAPVVLYVGTNMQRKGVPDLIRAAPAIVDSVPDVLFWLVGLDPAIPALQSLARQLNVANHFYFLGWKSRTELIKLYARATIFAMPSLTEALGIALLEAMAAGVPVISTRVGGIPEIITDGVNGRLVPPRNPPILAAAIIELLQNSALQSQFRQAALDTLPRFSVQAMMQCTTAIYEHILNHPQT